MRTHVPLTHNKNDGTAEYAKVTITVETSEGTRTYEFPKAATPTLDIIDEDTGAIGDAAIHMRNRKFVELKLEALPVANGVQMHGFVTPSQALGDER